jgi:hypothetical protein
MGIWFALLSTAPGQTESAQFFFGTNADPASVLDRPRLETEAQHPELFHPPNVGDACACRAFRGEELAREIAGTVVSATVLECADGPEIALHPGDLRLDLLRALYLTDVLHRSPQTLDEEPPSEPFLPPTFEVPECAPTNP